MWVFVRHWLCLHEVMALYGDFIAKEQNQVYFLAGISWGRGRSFTTTTLPKQQGGLRKE